MRNAPGEKKSDSGGQLVFLALRILSNFQLNSYKEGLTVNKSIRARLNSFFPKLI